MGIQILMREDGAISPFRDALLSLMEMPGETLILSTGYADSDILTYCSQFVSNIHKGFIEKQSKNTSIIVLGGKLRHKDPNNLNSNNKIICSQITRTSSPGCNKCTMSNNCWQIKFERFVNILQQKLQVNKYNHKIKFYRANTDEYHGKVAIKLYNNKPIAAIVGSSNLTTPAFGKNINFFNHEADIFIWSGQALRGTKLQGYKGVSIKDYTINDLKGMYSNKLKELIRTEIEYLNQYINLNFSIDLKNETNKLEDLNVEEISIFKYLLKSKIGIKDENHEVFQFISNIVYYKNVFSNIDKHINYATPLIINVSVNQRTTQSILLDIYQKFSNLKDNLSKEVLPQQNGNFYIF